MPGRGRGRALGRGPRARRRRRAGSARATRCGSRSATRCTATTSRRRPTRSRPGSAGRARSTRSSPASTSCAAIKEAGPGAEARRVRDGREGGPAAGHADRRRRRGHLRHALADARRRHRDGLRPGRARPSPAPSSRSTSAASRARRARRQEADLQARGVADVAAAESYPDELRYHPEHDWARIEGDEATLGITWFAQDALGELVHFEPPDEGSSIAKDADVRRGRVGEGRLGCDRAALGRDARGEPEGRRRARDGERGSRTARAGSSASGSPTRPRSTRCSTPTAYRAARSPSSERRATSRSPTPTARRCSRRSASSSVDELFRDIPAGVRFERRARPRAGALRAGARAPPGGARGEERRHDEGALVPRRGHLRPLRAGGRRRGARSAASS